MFAFEIGELYISNYLLQWYANREDDCYLADSHNDGRDSGDPNVVDLVLVCSSISCDPSKTPSRGC